MKQSKFFNLNWADLGKGLLIAFLTALLGGILELLQAGQLPTTWVAFQPILELSLAAAVSYLLKNLFTNSEGQLARGEKSAAEYRAKRAGKLIILLPLFLLMTAGANAQDPWIGFKGFFRSTEPANLERYVGSVEVSPGVKALTSGVWQARFNAGMEAVALYPKLDEAGKMIGIDPREFSAFIFGLFFTHTQSDGFQDWSAGPFVAMPNIAAGYERYGIGVAGAYSVFKVGLKYDVGLPLKEGLCVMTGIKIDLFNQIN